jgi:hypothetical protein
MCHEHGDQQQWRRRHAWAHARRVERGARRRLLMCCRCCSLLSNGSLECLDLTQNLALLKKKKRREEERVPHEIWLCECAGLPGSSTLHTARRARVRARKMRGIMQALSGSCRWTLCAMQMHSVSSACFPTSPLCGPWQPSQPRARTPLL